MTTPFRGNTIRITKITSSRSSANWDEHLASVSYVGSQAHHLLMIYSANPGNPALCAALSKPSAVAPNTQTCGPGGEDDTYHTADGRTINGTRGPFGSNFSNDDFEGSFGNSSYNSLQASIRHSAHGLDLCCHTYNKSIDQASVSPTSSIRLTTSGPERSAWDQLTIWWRYSYQFPLER
jgi:hypothetical protein